MRYYTTIIPMLAVLLSTGCVTTSQGEVMQTEIETLKVRQSELDKSLSADREQFALMLKQAQEDVEQIRKVMGDATALLQRNSADFGADFERFQQDFATLRGKVETLSFNLEKTQKDLMLFKEDVDLRLSSAPTQTSSAKKGESVSGTTEMGTNPESMLKTADDLLEKGEFAQAREIYDAFLATYPNDENTDRAIYGKGNSYLRQNQPKEAGKQFEKILSSYPKSEYIDDAYYKLGDVFILLGSCTNAGKFYNRIIVKYPDSPLVDMARARVKAIENKSICK